MVSLHSFITRDTRRVHGIFGIGYLRIFRWSEVPEMKDEGGATVGRGGRGKLRTIGHVSGIGGKLTKGVYVASRDPSTRTRESCNV